MQNMCSGKHYLKVYQVQFQTGLILESVNF